MLLDTKNRRKFNLFYIYFSPEPKSKNLPQKYFPVWNKDEGGEPPLGGDRLSLSARLTYLVEYESFSFRLRFWLLLVFIVSAFFTLYIYTVVWTTMQVSCLTSRVTLFDLVISLDHLVIYPARPDLARSLLYCKIHARST